MRNIIKIVLQTRGYGGNIIQCAPFLKKLKVSCVISVEESLYDCLSELFDGMDIDWHMLSCTDGKCLVLFYRPGEFKQYLQEKSVREILEEYGYSQGSLGEMLDRLSVRVTEFADRKMGFPHEIGIFLGYPP